MHGSTFERFTAFRDACLVQTYCARFAPWSTVLGKDEVRRNHECVQKHQELLTLSAKYVAFAARREPQCTTKNILELTIARKIRRSPSSPTPCLLRLLLWDVFYSYMQDSERSLGNDRERMEYVGGDKTIVREVDAQLNTSTRRSLSWLKHGK